MRFANDVLLNALTIATTQTSTSVSCPYTIKASVIASVTGTPTGTLVLQGCNDLNVPVIWATLPNTSQTISTAGVAIIPATDVCHQFLRIIYTATGAGVQTVSPIADTGVKQAQTVTTVADVAGSLNSTYFLLSSVNTSTKAQKNFYLWLDDGSGIDPVIAGRTAIHVTYTSDDTANTIATQIRSALNALTGDFVASGSNAAVIITNVAFGPVTAAVDGAAATGFTFGSATTGVASNLNNKYFLLQDEASVHSYYVWMNVDTIGTDPTIAGRTGVPIAFSSGATASTIGSDLATAIGALNSSNSFTTSGTSTVTITNKVAGPFVPASDVSTGFAFAVTAGSGAISATLNTIGF